MKAKKIYEFQKKQNPYNALGIGALKDLDIKLIQDINQYTIYSWYYKSANGTITKDTSYKFTAEILLDIKYSNNIVDTCIDFRDIINFLNLNKEHDYFRDGSAIWMLTKNNLSKLLNTK